MEYKTLEELKKELGDKLEEYMYNANIELLTKFDKAKEYINNASYFDGSSMCANDLLEILGDKENG